MRRWIARIAIGLSIALFLLQLFFVSIKFNWWAPIRPVPETWGSFSSQPQAEWLNDGREMKILKEFSYKDPRGKLWSTPAGEIVDGASIPQAFWSLVGGPFEGKHRNASIVHDSACYAKTEKSEDVHYMFYEACRCGGVSEADAKLLYAAVYQKGPSWVIRVVEEIVVRPDGTQEKVRKVVHEMLAKGPPPQQDVASKLQAYIKKHNPSIEELQKLDWSKLE